MTLLYSILRILLVIFSPATCLHEPVAKGSVKQVINLKLPKLNTPYFLMISSMGGFLYTAPHLMTKAEIIREGEVTRMSPVASSSPYKRQYTVMWECGKNAGRDYAEPSLFPALQMVVRMQAVRTAVLGNM